MTTRLLVALSILVFCSCGGPTAVGHPAEQTPVTGGPPRVTSPSLSDLTARRVEIRTEGCASEAWLCRTRDCTRNTARTELSAGVGHAELEAGTWFVQGRCPDGRASAAIAFQVTATGFTRRAGTDVNGDGYADLVAGADAFGEPLPGAGYGPGAVAVYFGGAEGVNPTPQLIEAPEGGRFGTQLGHAGDVDDDGYDDVLATAICAPWENGACGPGRVYLLRGSAEGLVLSDWAFEVPPPRTTARHLQVASRLTARGVGDVDGDGFGDVAVGVSTGRATVWLFQGGPDGLSATASSRAESPDPESKFGDRLFGGVDMNDDGHADVAVAFQAFRELPIYLPGSQTGLHYDDTIRLGPRGGGPGSSFAVGDVDGDGRLELAMGWFLRSDRGMVAIYRSPLEPSTSSYHPLWTAPGEEGGHTLGASLAAGDVDGDGKADLITGLPLTVLPGGTGDPLPGRQIRAIEKRYRVRNTSGTGEVVASPGDLNDDGYADVATSSLSGGRLLVFYGSEAGLEPEPRHDLQTSPRSNIGTALAQ